MTLNDIGFGVEIETCLLPKYGHDARVGKGREQIQREHYQWFGGYLTNQYGLPARGNVTTKKHPPGDDYTQWWITFDNSIASFQDHIKMECVSPKLKSSDNYSYVIERVWEAIKNSHQVTSTTTCGTHVHVAPQTRTFHLNEVRKIAFACCYYEPYIISCLPVGRRENKFCKRNSNIAGRMGGLLRSKRSQALARIAADIQELYGFSSLIDYMQGDRHDEQRRALWNFQNLERTGTIEFRGGEQMFGPNKTIRWIHFVIAFVLMALHENLIQRASSLPVPSNAAAGEVQEFWSKLRNFAYGRGFGAHLPSHFTQMSERS